MAELKPKQKKTKGKFTRTVLRNGFYGDHQPALYLFVLSLIATITVLSFFVFYQMLLKPEPLYFQTHEDGSLLEEAPLTEPKLTENALLQFTTDALVSAYTYNYINYNEVLEEVKKYFTPKGYQLYQKAFRDARILQAVAKQKLIVSAVPTGAPIILASSPLPPQNFWTWQVEIPMRITYQSSDETLRQELKVTVLITRVPTSLSPRGVMIRQITLRETR